MKTLVTARGLTESCYKLFFTRSRINPSHRCLWLSK